LKKGTAMQQVTSAKDTPLFDKDVDHFMDMHNPTLLFEVPSHNPDHSTAVGDRFFVNAAEQKFYCLKASQKQEELEASSESSTKVLKRELHEVTPQEVKSAYEEMVRAGGFTATLPSELRTTPEQIAAVEHNIHARIKEHLGNIPNADFQEAPASQEPSMTIKQVEKNGRGTSSSRELQGSSKGM
jgi:hypothetical protein